MKLFRRLSFSPLANGLTILAIGVIGYAPFRALLVGSSTIGAVATSSAKAPVLAAAHVQGSPIERGRNVYMQTCFACHQPDGKGLPGIFPPLAGADYLMADRERAIRVVTKGLTGPVTVNGKTYNNVMPPQTLTEQQIADVLTYVMSSWGNRGGAYTAEDVRRVKAGGSLGAKPKAEVAAVERAARPEDKVAD